ncbi:hypothetical protein GCM10020221_00920 [Streptomyces thioluteus]|uniref:Uncharacterized protein n=1 Tax=Streptomyces thioluteus TaxID=66431 RepID=A0ABP6ISZ5_STRTU
MKTAAESRVAVVTQLTFAEEVSRSFWMRPRIGTTRVCIIETTIAARLRAKTIRVSFLGGAEELMGGSFDCFTTLMLEVIKQPGKPRPDT